MKINLSKMILNEKEFNDYINKLPFDTIINVKYKNGYSERFHKWKRTHNAVYTEEYWDYSYFNPYGRLMYRLENNYISLSHYLKSSDYCDITIKNEKESIDITERIYFKK